MPRIKIENIPKLLLSVIAKDLVRDFSSVVECPPEWVTVAASGVENFTVGYPIVDIYWFERPKELQDKAAKAIEEWLGKAGYNRFEIYFHVENKEGYYCSGQ